MRYLALLLLGGCISLADIREGEPFAMVAVRGNVDAAAVCIRDALEGQRTSPGRNLMVTRRGHDLDVYDTGHPVFSLRLRSAGDFTQVDVRGAVVPFLRETMADNFREWLAPCL